ncbi:sorbosone dehydrogenase family protein [Hymenobacter sp. NBH84]|uniref:PQQ-dependent sugar dehydrogenase n=1 Tax=Hymenobacter sp. NBH84 TaxID=2596915 RepID=UPI0016252B6C|nr:PQQ-dependent sugar dehydrogenase [Hymenobacter sp. NBH84]QNE39468.1 sorbosone dehydrogenase family protein [Hymenobacter sp. NBH84]
MNLWKKFTFALAVSAGSLVGCSDDSNDLDTMIPENEKEPTTAQIQGFVFYPALTSATEANVQQLKVPAGFAVNKFAEGVGKPRIIAVDDAGHVYVSDRASGTVTLLQDTNNDGKADIQKIVATIRQAHGLAIQGGRLYVMSVNELYSTDINMADGTLGRPQLLLSDLPDGGQHPNRTLAFGPDGKLYMSVGSTCNSCPEPNPENATMLVANADGSDRRIFAKGLRNTIGFGWHPQTKEFWGMDHGIDWLGDDEQQEELNKITDGADYGWPYIYGAGNYNPSDRPSGTTYAEYAKRTTNPTLSYQAHSAPMAMVFYTGTQFPQEYQNDAFVAMRGSWNRSSPVGYKVVRVHFENGQPTRFDDFLSGFLVNSRNSHFGRLVGLAVNRDGSLLVSDDTNGVIYRVARQ